MPTLKQKIGISIAGLAALIGCDEINPPMNIERLNSGIVKAIDSNGKNVEYEVLVTDYNKKKGTPLDRRVITAIALDEQTIPYGIEGVDYGNNGSYEVVSVYNTPEWTPSLRKDGLGVVIPYDAGQAISSYEAFLNSVEREVVPYDELHWPQNK